MRAVRSRGRRPRSVPATSCNRRSRAHRPTSGRCGRCIRGWGSRPTAPRGAPRRPPGTAVRTGSAGGSGAKGPGQAFGIAPPPRANRIPRSTTRRSYAGNELLAGHREGGGRAGAAGMPVVQGPLSLPRGEARAPGVSRGRTSSSRTEWTTRPNVKYLAESRAAGRCRGTSSGADTPRTSGTEE